LPLALLTLCLASCTTDPGPGPLRLFHLRIVSIGSSEDPHKASIIDALIERRVFLIGLSKQEDSKGRLQDSTALHDAESLSINCGFGDFERDAPCVEGHGSVVVDAIELRIQELLIGEDAANSLTLTLELQREQTQSAVNEADQLPPAEQERWTPGHREIEGVLHLTGTWDGLQFDEVLEVQVGVLMDYIIMW
nr:hypothetical protein [bacterium]